MIEIAQPESFVNEDENMIVSVDGDDEEAPKTLTEPTQTTTEEEICRVASTSSNSPPINPTNTDSSSRSSAVRDSPGSPCTPASFSLPSSNRRSATPNSENDGGLKLPQSIDGTSSGLSPTSTTSSSQVGLPVSCDLTENPSSTRKLSQAAVEKRHICDVCGKGFPYLSILDSHKRCHTGERPFSCNYCDKSFSQKATLQVHERTHTGERPYKCKYCPKTFAQYGTKTVHEKSSHLGVRNYKCPVCGKCLSSPSALYTHKKTHGDKIFSCTLCSKTFTLKNYLKLHVRQVHQQNDKRHICRFCQKSFSYAGSLQVHLRTHTGEKPYSCSHCDKAFASQGNLQSHERTHTNTRPYTCSICNRSFIQKSQLTSHEATHQLPSASLNESESNMLLSAEAINAQLNSLARSPPILQDQTQSQSKMNDFACKFCGKRYMYASSLYVHLRLHTGERPFICSFDGCDKSFTSQGNLIVHLRSHTGERPFQCSGCHKAYAQKVGLKIHQEQCQMLLNRRGSVVTVGTNESDSSPSLMDSDDYIVVDEDKEPNFFLNAPVKPKPLHLTNNTNQTIFSPPTNSQRESFSSEVFFPGTPLMSPTMIPNQTQSQLSFPTSDHQQQAFQLDSLARLASSLKMMPQPTSSSFDALTRQNESLLSLAPTSTASSITNNNYKDSLSTMLIEQQLLQNLQKLQQLLQAPPPMPTNNLLGGLLNFPTQTPAIPLPQADVLSQFQLSNLLLPPAPQQPSNSLTATLAAALNDLARQNAQTSAAPSITSNQMFIGNCNT